MRNAALLLAFALAGCASTAGINKNLGAAWVGKPVDQFFVKNGPPANQFRTQDGQTVYSWSKRETAAGTPVFCDLRIVADPKGITTDIGVQGSSVGAWSGSYCSEALR